MWPYSYQIKSNANTHINFSLWSPSHIIILYADEESEPLNTSTTGPTDSLNSSSNINNNNTSWKKYTIAATTLLALVALFNHHSNSSSRNNIAPDSVDLLSKHHDATDLMHHGHSKKAAGKEKKHELTKAELNTKLFDAKRKL